MAENVFFSVTVRSASKVLGKLALPLRAKDASYGGWKLDEGPPIHHVQFRPDESNWAMISLDLHGGVDAISYYKAFVWAQEM